jgi:hypothetical protein
MLWWHHSVRAVAILIVCVVAAVALFLWYVKAQGH